ncbi:hypothetical protein ASPWEDRAFT_43924 [Aspergillus wentii DTO 134E9]|uniref:Uncharacterized protein n=1 Tax=Aspergillus wentii DTO 134E9 TaxID=1073089 RepID=A0A1L9RAH0_ASPWE|nr:uncharacterized protein ASPWEDRAFT_43924 [Aspergillus wentii DTO 134E9]KAI9934490.1 hypothetical protein MW887_000104 [Aspergillus wentii]OJJ31899.1 hypothetical protein ASPWEDRAFT_43924 [Aspergillus wentii DTO 134E9]
MPSRPQPERNLGNASVKAQNGSQTSDYTDTLLKREGNDSKPRTSFPQTSAEKQQDLAGIGRGAESTWCKH